MVPLPPADSPEGGAAWIREAKDPLEKLLRIMSWLRSDRGCPWDRKQTHESLRRYAVEEAHELAEAVDSGEPDRICEELGDLLLQVVFHAQVAEEAGSFDFSDVAGGITEKLWRRHPHVFGEEHAETPEDVERTWEQTKAAERNGEKGALDGVPRSLPALSRCLRLTERAARVGFDWDGPLPVADKMAEEAGELIEAVSEGEGVQEELGDLLFAIANLARHLGVDPEEALQGTNDRFTRRFRHVESGLRKAGRTQGEASLEEMDEYWEEAKRLERKPEGVDEV